MKANSAFYDKNIKTPFYVVEIERLKKNLKVLEYVKDKTGCKILLALKAFSMYNLFDLISKSLDGTTASGLYEARLGKEKMSGEVHVYSPAYSFDNINEIASYSDHIVFNTPSQLLKFNSIVKKEKEDIQVGLRINPEYSELDKPIYDPSSPYSRLGTTYRNFDESILGYLDGMHFHSLCEQGSETLARTLKIVEARFGKYFDKLSWINFGGGHHITRNDYDVELLIQSINYIKKKYNVQVYLEPGEAVVLNTGFFVSEVLDIFNNGMDLAILDTSAACHMPDVLEMPYRPEVIGARKPNELEYTYRLGGMTCLAGDIIGDYSFDRPLEIGDRLVFTDMAHYTMVKNNTFNGMALPSIAVMENQKIKIVKQFDYLEFRRRI